jgi:hypothetical protein
VLIPRCDLLLYPLPPPSIVPACLPACPPRPQAFQGNEPVVRLLLQSGADRAIQNNQGQTAAQAASKNSHRKLARNIKNPKWV